MKTALMKNSDFDRRWLPLNALRAFEAVGRNLSFVKGARALNVTQSALSHQIGNLETSVGCQLLHRKPRDLRLTSHGAALLHAVTRGLNEIEDTLNEILCRSGDRTGPLRLHLPLPLMRSALGTLFIESRRIFPGTVVEVSTEGASEAAFGRHDLAIVYDRASDDGQVRELLWIPVLTPLCAPSLAEAARDRSIRDFLAGNLLLHVRRPGLIASQNWAAFASRSDLEIDTDSGLHCDCLESAVQIAMQGGGVVLADKHMFAADLARRTLARPYPDELQADYGCYLRQPAGSEAEPMASFLKSVILNHCARI